MATRVQNSKKNLIMNVISQVITLILSFVSRSVFISTLGVDYLGVNGLFLNILSVLSLAELGVGTAIVFSMYRPLVDHDERKLAALTGYYKKLYNIIAVIVLCVGLCIFPFLDYIVNLDSPIPNVKYYYLMFLAEAVSSYLLIYKTSIIQADQKGYILTRNRAIANIITVVLQIVVLVLTQDYILYLVIHIAIPLLCNIYNSRAAVKMYPYINLKEELPKEEKKNIWTNIKSMFLYKIGGVILNNIDNILISIIISTTVVGLYSNYSMIISRITTFASLIFTSVQASLGNFNVNADKEKQLHIFKVLSMISFWVYGFCSVCFCVLFQDFITIWLGDAYLLDYDVMLIAVANFYFQGVLYPVWCFRQTTGLFRDTKYTMLAASAVNLILSIVLGNVWGLFGILFATAIARLTTNLWFDPMVLFRKYFKEPVWKYYVREILQFVGLCCVIFLSMFVFHLLDNMNIYIRFIIELIYCILVPNMFMILYYFKKPEFKYVLQKVIKGKRYQEKGDHKQDGEANN